MWARLIGSRGIAAQRHEADNAAAGSHLRPMAVVPIEAQGTLMMCPGQANNKPRESPKGYKSTPSRPKQPSVRSGQHLEARLMRRNGPYSLSP